jgi:hypothetical protein
MKNQTKENQNCEVKAKVSSNVGGKYFCRFEG